MSEITSQKLRSFFQVFIKRYNVFNHILSHEKGFSFLQMLEEPSLRLVTYAEQRFASSSYNQWLKIERSFSSYWKAFEILHPNREETEEWQYMICGSDFIQDLLGLIDILKPAEGIVLHMQSLHGPVWKLRQYWPKVRDALTQAKNGISEAYPTLSKVIKDLHLGGTYKSVTKHPKLSIALKPKKDVALFFSIKLSWLFFWFNFSFFFLYFVARHGILFMAIFYKCKVFECTL